MLYPDEPKPLSSCRTAYNRDFKTTGGTEILIDAFVGLQYEQDKLGVTILQDVYRLSSEISVSGDSPTQEIPNTDRDQPYRGRAGSVAGTPEGVPHLNTAVEPPGAVVVANFLCYR